MVLETLEMNWGYLVMWAVLLIVIYSLIRTAIVNYRIRKYGWVRAPRLANNPFVAIGFFIQAGRKQMENDLLSFFESIFKWGTPQSPNCVEISAGSSVRFLLTREPEHLKTILTSKFSDFGKGPRFHEVWRPFLGDSIFTTDGQMWHDSRALIRPMFVRDRVRDLDIFDRWTNALISKLPPPGETVEVSDLFYRMTLDVITDFLMGQPVHALDNEDNEFARSFNEVQRFQMMLTIMAPLRALVPTRKYHAGIREIERFMMPYIEQALALPREDLEKLSDGSSSKANYTFLHSIARYSRDPKVIRDQIMAILLAGRDTTAATLSWCLYELSNSPATVRRLRGEILSVLGHHGRRPTYDDLKAMTYLTHTLNETLRLYPAVPYNIRAALEDTSLPGVPAPGVAERGPDIAVLKGDVVVYSTLSMQRRPDLYPGPDTTTSSDTSFPDPAVFCPDRWDNWTPKPWTYVPFNGGPRICVGQNFAMTEMAYCLVLLLQKYDRIEYHGDWQAQFHKAEIVGAPGQGVPVAFFQAEDGV